MPTAFGGVARGPGAVDQGSAGMAITSLGDAALTAPGAGGVCRRRQGKRTPQLSGGVATGESASCGHGRHGAWTLDAAQGLEGVDHRPKPPGLPLVCAFLLSALQPCGVLGHSADVFWQDDLLCWRGTDDLAEPPERGRAPGRPACVTDILPEEQGFEPKLRGLEIADGLFTRPAQVPHRFILYLGNVDRGEVPRAHQACQFESIAAVGFDPIPGLCGD